MARGAAAAALAAALRAPIAGIETRAILAEMGVGLD
jgi:hypothetical protein